MVQAPCCCCTTSCRSSHAGKDIIDLCTRCHQTNATCIHPQVIQGALAPRTPPSGRLRPTDGTCRLPHPHTHQLTTPLPTHPLTHPRVQVSSTRKNRTSTIMATRECANACLCTHVNVSSVMDLWMRNPYSSCVQRRLSSACGSFIGLALFPLPHGAHTTLTSIFVLLSLAMGRCSIGTCHPNKRKMLSPPFLYITWAQVPKNFGQAQAGREEGDVERVPNYYFCSFRKPSVQLQDLTKHISPPVLVLGAQDGCRCRGHIQQHPHEHSLLLVQQISDGRGRYYHGVGGYHLEWI